MSLNCFFTWLYFLLLLKFLGVSTGWKCKSAKDDVAKYLRCRKDTKLALCLVEDGTIHPCCDPPRVIIIGAGLAGLSAANRLLQCGIENFVVLEGTDRPGGRIHSCYMGKVVTEMGASTIYGGSIKNPMYVLASREGLIPAVPVEYPLNRGICMTSDGVAVPKLVNRSAPLGMSLILKQAYDLDGKETEDFESVWDFFYKRIHQECSLYPEMYRRYAARYMLAITNDLRSKEGADLSKISASHYGSYIPGKFIRIPTGMVGTLAPLLRTMPSNDHILYCKSVNKIMWSDKLSNKSDRVNVVCCDGTSYKGDYAIVTVPLGVLKEKYSMFVPSLPTDKSDAIEKVGFGNICNIFLEYQKPFWVWKNGTLRLGWSLEELKSRRSCPDWIKGIGSVDETVGSQQSLMFTVADEEADVAEKLSDVRVAEDATRMLRMFTGDPTLPYPVNILKSSWKSSPYFRGAQAYVPIGCSISDLCSLAAPVPNAPDKVPTLFFAGEAVAEGMIGTLHGARMSGVRAANEILKITQIASGKPNPNMLEAMGWLKEKEEKNIALKN